MMVLEAMIYVSVGNELLHRRPGMAMHEDDVAQKGWQFVLSVVKYEIPIHTLYYARRSLRKLVP